VQIAQEHQSDTGAYNSGTRRRRAKGKPLEDFGEEWGSKWATSQEVVEGIGGNTDWQAFTAMVDYDEKAFPSTEPMLLSPI
jgi:hypothetical protein